jgi:hypothetical protein
MPVNPTYTVRLGWHATDLDTDGHLPAEQLTTPETTTTKVLAPDGAGGVHWGTVSATSSFGSNSNAVGSANAPGASSSNARADHVHQGVHQLTSNGSNGLVGESTWRRARASPSAWRARRSRSRTPARAAVGRRDGHPDDDRGGRRQPDELGHHETRPAERPAKSQDTTLTGWTTAVAAGDILRFNVDSATTVTRVTLSLTATRA